MNGLTLRISGSNSKKIKGSLAYTPVIIPKNLLAKIDDENILVEKFQKCHSVDEQLSVLKENLNTSDDTILNFLVIIFLQSEMKHPVKCFLVRYITKNNNLQESFSKALALEILSYISTNNVDCKVYMEIIPRIASCIENFPAGGMAIKQIEVELSEYLTQCLQCCVDTLRYMKSLSPTEKNEIFNLAHLTLRMLLYIVQKVTFQNNAIITATFSKLRLNIKELLFDEEVPMDTKSVCGILLITMYNLQEGSNAWIEILKTEVSDWEFNSLMENDSAKLSLYSAISTVVPTPELSTVSIGRESALIKLTYNILAIGEKTSSDSTFTLSVTRTLVQISKTLSKASNRNLGLQLVDCLLTFVWSHLEHYMDSVRHLTGQVLANIVRYCTELKKTGDNKALDNLFTALTSLDRSRKSYYVSLTSLTSELGASCILERMPNAICDTIKALDIQAVQASATTALETLLHRHSKETSSETLYKSWVKPILSHVTTNALDSAVLNILENILLQAVRLDENIMDYLLPYIKQLPSTNENGRDDLKCVLMLLSVVRKSNVAGKLEATDKEWKGLISYEILKMAAVNVVDETRILSLSLIVESPKSTEAFTPQELELVLWYLKYNINAQAPNFRQLTLSLMKKFIKRLEDSYKVLKRQKGLNDEYNKGDYYLSFVEKLRDFCYGCLIRGVNYSRRYVALQVLVWCEGVSLEGYHRTWQAEYVENLLIHLEDSYETNKAFALEILNICPVEMIQEQRHVIGLELDQILRQASSVKPTDCISAAYKLQLMVDRLPEGIPKERDYEVAEAVRYRLACVLLQELRRELRVCERCVLRAAGEAPLHGLLHAARHLLEHLHPGSISQDQSWSSLIEQIINTCVEVNAAVACVVNNSSPEGHLPMDMSGVVITDHGNSGNVRLEDGRLVTAQMVLLCAWRSVKEVSLLLGSLSSRMTIQGEEHDYGTLSQQQVVLIGEHFTKLLAETKHRGAFEQAYVGFTKLLSRLWQCRSESLHSLPRRWLTELLQSIAADDGTGLLSATRRSAGLPFMIQALVSTELQVSEKPVCLDECVAAMLRCGGAHASNVLRTLLRCAALQQRVGPHVARVLLHALRSFDAHSWQERNSATLLLSALVVRVFGVARARSADRLSSRNTMTGRMFFLRYPQLYDFMLEKLQASGNDDAQLLTPSLYPILLLLARLYPSALEGTVSNLKLASFIGPVVSCARSSVLKTRQLAARAIVPLISPNLYIPHIEEMLTLIADKKIKRNFCHGILLQVIKLLDNKPDNLTLEEDAIERLHSHIKSTQWILELTADQPPCYLLMDEYWKMVNLLIWRFPSLIDQNIIEKVIEYLNILLTQDNHAVIAPGQDICLANATSLYFIILNKYGNTDEMQRLIYTTLSHKSYEVVLASLNYLLILYNELDPEDKLQEHLSLLRNESILEILKTDPKYTSELSQVLKTVKYLECKQKCLKVLSLEDDTQKYIIEANLINRELSDEIIISGLIHLVENEHEKFTHIYLYSLTSFLMKKLRESDANEKCILEAVRVIFACSSSENSDSTRGVVAGFLESNFKLVINMKFHDLTEEEKFEMKASLLATLVCLLEDDEEALRQRCSGVVVHAANPALGAAVGSRCAELLLRLVCGSSTALQLLAVLALLDFRCQVCLSDQADDECRVFDQNEKYNVFLEETIWTVACADHIKQIYKGSNICERILEMFDDPLYKQTFDKLCGGNVGAFRNILNGLESDMVNPKVALFLRELRR